MANLRLFVAVPVPGPVKAALVTAQKALTDANPHVRSTGLTGIHLTLKFLGDTPEQRIPDLRRALEETAHTLQKPIRLSCVGAGAFPNLKEPRVLWAGLAGDVAELTRMQQVLDVQLAKLGIPREARPFHAHLTLGRMKMPKMLGALHKAMEKIAAAEFGDFTAEALVLYSSELRPTGAVYTSIERVPLPAD
jgi:2'-5' RNA ligase